MKMAGPLHPPMSSEETPPTPSPPDGEDCALLRSFLLSPRGKPRGGPGFFFQKKKRKWGVHCTSHRWYPFRPARQGVYSL